MLKNDIAKRRKIVSDYRLARDVVTKVFMLGIEKVVTLADDLWRSKPGNMKNAASPGAMICAYQNALAENFLDQGFRKSQDGHIQSVLFLQEAKEILNVLTETVCESEASSQNPFKGRVDAWVDQYSAFYALCAKFEKKYARQISREQNRTGARVENAVTRSRQKCQALYPG